MDISNLTVTENICNRQQVTPIRGNQVASLEMQKMVTEISPMEIEPTKFVVGQSAFFPTAKLKFTTLLRSISRSLTFVPTIIMISNIIPMNIR